MNGARTRKTCNLEKPFPGCLERMVNLLDLNTSVAGNRFITDKPHPDGPLLSVGRLDGATMSPIVDPIEDKEIVSELRRGSSNKKSNAMPMKMLIAQDMSEAVESKHNPPNVVAKLMGLDALPQKKPDSAARKRHSRGHARSHSGIPMDSWQQDGFEMHMQQETQYCRLKNECKDVYEIRQKLQKGNCARESPQKGWHNNDINEKKMALIRQKFTEAKCLSTDEKLRQSKQFQDAVEVLSYNKDLFLQFLEEQNSFSQHLFADFLPVPPPASETKRITVLRPSKVVGNDKRSQEDEKQIKKASSMDQPIGWDKSNPGFPPPNCRFNDNPTQATQIVILKPSLGKPQDIKAWVSPPFSPPRVLHGQELYEDGEDNERQESREEAKVATWKKHENRSGHRRDETLLSSLFYNDYMDDGSSFNKPENDYAAGNNSEREVVSPTSRHSWDYINRFGSPYSSSSFSSASYSPESSVCREAKKRLSERWAMMASNGNSPEQRHVWRSSSTLGEMLSLSDTKNSVKSEQQGTDKEPEPRGSKSNSPSVLNKVENVDNSSRNLLRSKSLPLSSTVFGGIPNVEVPDPEMGKTHAKEVTKQQSVKSLLKERVSSLFFSKNKKTSKEKSTASQSKVESKASDGMLLNVTKKNCDDISQCANASGIEEGPLRTLRGSSSKTSLLDFTCVGPKQATIYPHGTASVIKLAVSGKPSENQDHPSPSSVLEPPFEEDNMKSESYRHGAKPRAHSIKSNLIDKSPPIESIAHTFSWDNSCVETSTSYSLKPSLATQEPEVEEREWLFYIQSLLSAAGLDGEVQSGSFFSRWHSPETLLDPSLRDKYIDLNAKETMHGVQPWQMRSTQKLVFDCVNEALVDITRYGSEISPRAISCGRVFGKGLKGASSILVDQVWDQVKEWFPHGVGCFSGTGGDNRSLVVESVVRKEVVGKGWVEQRRLEIDNIGKEIEGMLLEELVQEAVVELIGCVC